MAANFGTGYFADRPTGAQLFDMVVSGAGGIVDQHPGPGTQRYPAADSKVQIMFQILFQQPAVGIILIPAGKLPGLMADFINRIAPPIAAPASGKRNPVQNYRSNGLLSGKAFSARFAENGTGQGIDIFVIHRPLPASAIFFSIRSRCSVSRFSTSFR